jgi:putative nucleotidyltransferase with HDIG domain
MRKYKLPTRKQCFDIMKECGLPSHIVAHSLAVAGLAVFLAEKLKEKGIFVDVELIDRACLLHDIARPCDFRGSNGLGHPLRDCNCSKAGPVPYGTGQAVAEQSYELLPEDKATCLERSRKKWQQLKAKYQGLCHEDIAYELLMKEYPELATTVKRHRYKAILDEKEKPTTWEEKLVYYADKRIMHDRIVPLKERL